MSQQKKICVIVTSRADYGRVSAVLRALREHKNVTLQIVACRADFFEYLRYQFFYGKVSSAIKTASWYLWAGVTSLFLGKHKRAEVGSIAPLLRKHGFEPDLNIPIFLPRRDEDAMLEASARAIREVGKALKKLRPDIVLIHGDRFELLPIAMSAAFLNIPIAHIEGGDVSGTIDESIRHAISKLSHIHFPVTEQSKERLLRMGENPESIYVSGMSAIDTLRELDTTLDSGFVSRNGNGGLSSFEVSEPFALVMYHPVTTRREKNNEDILSVLEAVSKLPIQKVIIAPNIDAGSMSIIRGKWELAHTKGSQTVFYKNVPEEDFYRLLNNAKVAIGNSSSFLREAAYFGTPVVLVGDRQQGRERGHNVVEVPHDVETIVQTAQAQMEKGRYEPDLRFGSGYTGTHIAKVLAELDLSSISLQKKFH